MKLTNGDSLRYWQVSEIAEERFDVADAPLHGEMDPFFFLTKDRNFIPHEYPCRTEFAARFRNKRPDQRPGRADAVSWQKNVLPFGQDMLDLSGFWFRPTRLAAWARTVIDAAEAGPANLRLTTCGGAILHVNGTEAGWMAPYIRNYNSHAEFQVQLQAGPNEIVVFFDDLAERDTRYLIRLDYLNGPEAYGSLPFDAPAGTVRMVEALLDRMHFDKPAYDHGEVALILPATLSEEGDASVVIEGDFMSHERMDRRYRIEAGQDRLVLGKVGDFPADFRHFRITVSCDGFAATRSLGVEIAHPAGPAAEALADRVDEALRSVADKAEPDTVCALARLATGQQADEMILRALPPIEDCWDCADFALVPLLWSRMRFADALRPETLAEIDRTILAYRYWMDEPGNDVQWYFSENHALLFHSAAYLAGHVLPDAVFRRSGRSGAEQSRIGAERVQAWLDHFETCEMAEFNSAPYFPIDLKGLCALYALAPDADIRDRAGRAIARLIEIVANSAHRGVLTAAQGRSYEHTLRAGETLELSAIARMLWGKGSFGARFHCLPQFALCLRDHGLDLPDLRSRALWDETGGQEWAFTQGENHFARLYHWKTRKTAMGSAARYRWYDWGYQETLIHARIGADPQAQIWINHPGELIQSGYGRPSYWGGSASVPRVQQYRGLALVMFDGVAPQPELTHAWFPQSVFDETRLDGNIAVATQDGAGLVIIGSAALHAVTEGPSAGNELQLAGRDGCWIIRLSDEAQDCDALHRRYATLSLITKPDGLIVIDDPEYGPVSFHADGVVEAEGRRLDPESWSLEGQRNIIP
ncbi:hypothetical protein [Paracoccus aerodenitrificans]|uniref:hypothetical protein n=1 Tax=Paracoccus aerodenitrificans TaxID=3017781 RepID=UPI0022F0BE5C|nr:hypothetical protein [Paracoccus aerodenitrificans]WBU65457.1 hypothetical protein PAE61_08580 [Paracoccus aerodenitrificans]